MILVINMANGRFVTILITLLATAALGFTALNIQIQDAQADMVQKRIYGYVDPNSTTSVGAYDAVQNGFVHFYIQNRTNEGNVEKDMKNDTTDDYYDPWINLVQDGEIGFINDWQVGDTGIMIINREYGTYGTNDHAGFVTYQNGTLDPLGTQVFGTVELLKIPIPIFANNGTGFQNISWMLLPDPNNLIAGYSVYRSTTNGSVGGDSDWGTPISGSIPLTLNWFNDTSVVGNTTYYYSLRVVFIGYQNDDPGQDDNYENQYFGEGSGPITAPPAPSVDFINITYSPGGMDVDTIVLNIGESTPQVYASGYNNVGPTYVGAVEVDWTWDPPSLGSCSPLLNTFTVFSALYQGGIVNVTGANGTLAVSDNFTVVINPPRVDYITLTDSPNGTPIPDTLWPAGVPLAVYASAYNYTDDPDTYIGLIEVDWTKTPITGGDGTFTNTTGVSTIFNGTIGGIVEIQGENTTLSVLDTFQKNIELPPAIDNILITDAPDGTEITIVDLLTSDSVTIYASGYNGTTYIGLVEVDWVDLGVLGTFDNATGTSTTYTAGGTPGLTTVEATNTTLALTDTCQMNITMPPTVDYIIITDMPDGTPLTNESIPIGGSITVYVSGYNLTGSTYVGLVEVDWSADPTNLGFFSTVLGTSTIYTVYTTVGSINITGENSSMIPIMSDNFTLNILPPMVDFILLQDAPDGTNLTTETLNVGFSMIIYASGYNNTGSTYVGLVAVDWTDVPDLGGFNVTPANTVTFTAGASTGSTVITGDAGGGILDTFDINIVQLTEDYILITDAPNGAELTTVTLDVGESVTIYASVYNDTGSVITYLGLLEVQWTQDPTLGLFDSTPGLTAIFTAGNAGGTTTITGTNSTLSLSDDFSLTVNPPIINYIMIVDTAGTGLTEIPDQTVNVGVSFTGYAASFNYTIGFLGDISVTWSVSDSGGASTQTAPTSGVSSVFNSGSLGGLTTWTADDGTNTDTVAFTISTPTVDYIQIRDAAGGAGNVVLTDTITEGSSQNYYCAAYNSSGGYIGDVGATWGVTGTIGTVAPTSGQLTQFSATTAGAGTVTATYSGATNSTSITVNAAEVAPDPPTGLAVNQLPAGESLRLTWDTHPDPDGDLAGYNVYRSTTNGTGFQLANTGGLITDTAFTDTNRTNGVVYYYRITAVDDSTLESANSGIVDKICDADPDDDGIYNLQDDDDDGDGLTDAEELELGTNPLLVDTDGDGHNDKEDKYPLDADKWKDEDEDSSILLILIIVIVIIVVLVLVLFLMKKKGPAEAPALPEEEVKPPGEEMPPEGEAPPEEDIPPPEDEDVPPSEEEVAPSEGETPPTEEEAPPAEERKLPPPP